MRWLLIIRSRHTYGEDCYGYDITTMSFLDKRSAEFAAEWLTKNTREGHIRTALIRDEAT